MKVGDAMHMDGTMTRCDYANTTCYKVKAVPVINSIDSTSGYTTGGQLVTVRGYGFNSENITTLIDGVPCTLISSSQEAFTCRTGSQPTPSSNSFYPGGHGLRRKFFNETYTPTLTNLTRSQNFTETLAMDLEPQTNYKGGPSGNAYTGYLKAPATARYRFYIACDDSCSFYISNGMDPA